MMNHQDVNAGGAGLMLNSMVIKRESFENDMSSSAEYDESGSEIGSIKADISDDQLRKLPDEKIASNGREARNRAEKNRRDKLNGSIQELSTMVPHVAESPRRVDKTAVLRYSAHGLRIHYVFGKTIDTSSEMKPMVPEALMKLLDSFLLTITCRGQIVLVSSSVEHHLGHCQTDLFGQNILQITHPDDHGLLKKQIIPTDLETLFDIQPEDESGEPRPRTQEEEDAIDRKLSADKRTFTVRLARAGPRSEPTTYEIVKLDGSFRRADSAPRGVKASTYPSGLQLIRRARGRDDSIPLHTISGNDIVLVAMARVIRPPKVSERILEANQYEYKTRHLIDGRIIHCDQRISLVAGYMTEEVNGLSPFTFMHQDDVRWVIVALRQMYDHNSSYGESCYRLITRTGKFVYLKTRGYLEIDKDTNKVHSFVCINTLISEEEGRKRVRDMKNKFSIIINTKIPPSAIDVPAAENPHQLERAIIYLIQNLQNPDDNGDDESDSQNKGALGSDIDKRYSKSPSLAIIPPKPCTIKSSIKKSVNVVTTARNYMQRKRLSKSKSPSSDSDNEDNNSRSPVIRMSNSPGEKNLDGQAPDDSNDPNAASPECVIKQEIDYEDQRVPPLPSAVKYFEMKCFATTVTSPSSAKDLFTNTCKHNYNNKQPYRSTSVLKRTHNADLFEEETGSSAAKRSPLRSFAPPSIQELTNPRSDLSQVLPSSFDAIDRSLLNIENAATELKEKLPSSQHQLDEIIVEHQEQRQMLETIHSEFQAHINNTGPTRPNIRDSNSAFHSKNELKPR